MILKGSAWSQQLRKAEPEPWCVLVFGEDEGVVADTADQVISSWAGKGKSPATALTLDDDEIRREPGLLYDRIETASLLGDIDIIRVRTSGEKIAKPVLDLVAQADAAGTPFANRLVLLAGTLNKRSKLRATIESAKTAAAIHVFSDTDQSVRELVQSRLDAEGVTIDLDALDRFTAQLPGHRGLANQETEKLTLFGRGLSRPVSLEDIRKLSLTDADSSVREMIRLALDGESEACLAEYERVVEAGGSAISVLRLLEMDVKRLLQARSLMGTGGNIGMKLKPPVWQSEWPAFRSRLDRWSAPALTRLLGAIHDHEKQAKESGPAAEAALRILLLNILKAASGRTRTPAAR